jgi:hypothetical protein
MAEPGSTNTYPGSKPMNEKASTGAPARTGSATGLSTAGVADQAMAAGRELKDKAFDATDAPMKVVRDKASELTDVAKDLAAQATGSLVDTVKDKQHAGADYVQKIADTMRRAAREFEADVPMAAPYIRDIASRVDDVAHSVRDGNLSDLVGEAQAFAKRQPTAFLALSMVAGFGLVRLWKISSTAGTGSRDTMSSSPSPKPVAGREW